MNDYAKFISKAKEKEIKVTVVATGLGGGAVRVPLQIVEGVVKTVAADLEGEINYKDFERPPAMRNSRRSPGGQVAAAPGNASEDYFDIPAFLRRQAD